MSRYPFVTHEPGTVPNLARDAMTGQPYRGLHQHALATLLDDFAATGYTDPRFLTDADAVALGAQPPDRQADMVPVGIATVDPCHPDEVVEEVLQVRPAIAYKGIHACEPIGADTQMAERLYAMFAVDDSKGVRAVLTNKAQGQYPALVIEHATWLVCGEIGIPYTPDRAVVKEAAYIDVPDEKRLVQAESLSDEIRARMRVHIRKRDDAHFGHAFTHVYAGKDDADRWSFRDIFRGALSPEPFAGKAALLALLLTGGAVISTGATEAHVRDQTIDKEHPQQSMRDTYTSERSAAGELVLRLSDIRRCVNEMTTSNRQPDHRTPVLTSMGYAQEDEAMSASRYRDSRTMPFEGGSLNVTCAEDGSTLTKASVFLDTPMESFGIRYRSESGARLHEDRSHWVKQTDYQYENSNPEFLNRLLHRERERRIQHELEPVR